MLQLNTKAPKFTLPNQDNIEISLKDLQGKWVVLYFYPKDNTPGCTIEACDFSEDLPLFEEIDATVIGVSPDSPKKHQNFIAKKNLTITLLSDESKEMIQNYGVWQLKKFMGKEYMGVIRTTYIIDPKGNIVFGWENVRVKNHAKIVREKLLELQ